MTTATDTHGFQNPASPPTKASLTSWWDKFKGKGNPKKEEPKSDSPGIFGVPLQESIKYAKVAISMNDANGDSFIYGYIPIVIAKCGVFLKEKATDVEGIFRLSGSAKRIKDLQVIFNSPDKYGKGLDWTGYTVHDAANILRRYLNQLPEPIIPLQYYDKFREPLQVQGTFNEAESIKTYQRLISEMPALNRQLLLYILDLLAVFSSKSDINLMPAANLAAIFQPGLISHPDHEMSPADYRLSQDVLIFLILNQDNFLLGMKGAEESANQGYVGSDVSPPSRTNSKSKLDRYPSNASAGAESVKKISLKRHASTSSKKSTSSPMIGSGSLSRSNTLPSKNKSPTATPSNFTPRTPTSPLVSTSPAIPADKTQVPEPVPNPQALTVDTEKFSNRPFQASDNPISNGKRNSAHRLELSPSVPVNGKGERTVSEFSEMVTPDESRSMINDDNLAALDAAMNRSTSPTTQQPLLTPTKERSFTSYFSKSPSSDPEKKANKLRKKPKVPGGSNPSAESSTTSLNGIMSPTFAAAQSAPPPANPDSQQPPLMPISASPPSSADHTPLGEQGKNSRQNGIHLVPFEESQSGMRVPVSPRHMSVPHSTGAQSASTTSLAQAVSQTPSAASSVSSKSSRSDETKPTEKHSKSRSIWRKSAHKLSITSASHAASDKLSGLMSPPFTKNHGSNASSHSLSGSRRRRSASVGEKNPEFLNKDSSTVPQRGASASGQRSPNAENTGAMGWIQKKINERNQAKGDRDALTPAQIPLPVTTPTTEKPEMPFSPKLSISK